MEILLGNEVTLMLSIDDFCKSMMQHRSICSEIRSFLRVTEIEQINVHVHTGTTNSNDGSNAVTNIGISISS